MIPISCPGRVEGQESNGGSVHPEAFPHYQAVHDYANAHGLEYAWEGTAAFEERLRTLSPEQFQIVAGVLFGIVLLALAYGGFTSSSL